MLSFSCYILSSRKGSFVIHCNLPVFYDWARPVCTGCSPQTGWLANTPLNRCVNLPNLQPRHKCRFYFGKVSDGETGRTKLCCQAVSDESARLSHAKENIKGEISEEKGGESSTTPDDEGCSHVESIRVDY